MLSKGFHLAVPRWQPCKATGNLLHLWPQQRQSHLEVGDAASTPSLAEGSGQDAKLALRPARLADKKGNKHNKQNKQNKHKKEQRRHHSHSGHSSRSVRSVRPGPVKKLGVDLARMIGFTFGGYILAGGPIGASAGFLTACAHSLKSG